MILISVISEVVVDKRQFKSDGRAITFLKRINKLHNLHRIAAIGSKPIRKNYSRKYLYEEAIQKYKADLSTAIPLKVEIINTKYNQLSLSI